MAKLEKKSPPPPDIIELAEIDDSKHPNPAQRCPSSKGCNKANCRKPWHQPYSKTNVVTKLRPILIFTGCAEAFFGSVLLVVVLMFAAEFDTLYGVEKSKMMSLLCFGGLVAMAVSGTLLLISVLLEKRTIMWVYVIASTFICVYIFGIAVVMMQYGLYNVPLLQMEFEYSNSSTSTPSSILNSSQIEKSHFLKPQQPLPILQMKFKYSNSSTSTPSSNLNSSQTLPPHLLKAEEPVPISQMKFVFSNSSTTTPSSNLNYLQTLPPHLLNPKEPAPILQMKFESSNSSTSTPSSILNSSQTKSTYFLNPGERVPLLQLQFDFSNSSTSTPSSILNSSEIKPPHLLYPEQPAPCTIHGNNFLFGKAFVISLLTLLGSVAHFVGTVTVFTYYNLKYIHPLLFYCHTLDL